MPFNLAFANAGNSIPARIAMIAITTSNSIKVKPDALRRMEMFGPGIIGVVFAASIATEGLTRNSQPALCSSTP